MEKQNCTNEDKKSAVIESIRACANHWPSRIVARSEIPNFTGGAIAARSIANHDSAGTGVHGAFKIGRTVVYPIDNLVEWLISRSEG